MHSRGLQFRKNAWTRDDWEDGRDRPVFHVPRPAGDPHLHLVLVGTLATGVGLWLLLPSGFSEPLVSGPWRLLGFLIFYPILEEWLFRGILQGELLRLPRGWRHRLGVSQANLLTSVLFVAFHAVHHPWYWALSVIVPSLVLGHLRERHENLWLPMVLHAFFNFTYLLAGLPWREGNT